MVKQSIQAASGIEPSPLCEKHQDGPSGDPCAGCLDAHLAWKRWDVARKAPEPPWTSPKPISHNTGQPPAYETVRDTLGIGTHYSKQGYLDATAALTVERRRLAEQREADLG